MDFVEVEKPTIDVDLAVYFPFFGVAQIAGLLPR